MDPEFLWQAEMACRAAWPAQSEALMDGWVARRSGGSIRRVNSLNQLPNCAEPDDRLIDRVEAHYARLDQQALVRMVSFVGHSTRPLLRRGYRQEGHTTTLVAELSRDRSWNPDGVAVSPVPELDWLAARGRIAASDPVLFRAMLELIEGDTLFAGATHDGIIQSVAYGAIINGMLVVESVATNPDHRGRGLARKAVGALIDWATGRGVDRSVLQVVADNVPARALYRSLGYTVRIYDYVYLRRTEVVRGGVRAKGANG